MGLRTKAKRLLKQVLFKDGTHKAQNTFRSTPRPTSEDAQMATPPAANRPLRGEEPENTAVGSTDHQHVEKEKREPDADVKAKTDADAKAKADADAKAKAKAKAAAKEKALKAKAKRAEAEAKAKAEKEKAKAEAKAKAQKAKAKRAEAEAKEKEAKAEAKAKAQKEKKENAQNGLNGLEKDKPFEFLPLAENDIANAVNNIDITRLFPETCPSCNAETKTNWGYREGEYYCTSCGADLN